MSKFLLSFLLFLIFLSCSDTNSTSKIEDANSFCYWKTALNFSENEQDSALEMKVNHMYIRYFDVDWDSSEKEARPVATLTVKDGELPFKNITPAVFFTNKVFQLSTKKQLDILAKRTAGRIEKINQLILKNNKNISDYCIPDILIDCDWSEGTKENFFYFVQKLDEETLDFEITTTLRLWQYKDQKRAGIPPVNRVLLMCYNLQPANQYGIQNSIVSLSEIKKYTEGVTYPLDIDIALPAFAWGVIFRQQKFEGLVTDSLNTYRSDTLRFEKVNKNLYRFNEEMVIGDFFARPGDELRIEDISKDELIELTQYLFKTLKMKDQSRITFFSWDQENINGYGTEQFKKIYSRNFN